MSHSKGGGPGGASRKSTSKLVSRLGPSFGRQTVSYTQHKNRTPNRTPTRTANARIMPASSGRSPDVNQRSFNMGIRSEDNSTTYDELSFEEDHGFRVNLYRSPTGDSFGDDDFDRVPEDPGRFYLDNGDDHLDSDYARRANCNTNRRANDVDQRPGEIDDGDTDYPIIFVENRVYIGPNDKDEFKCYDLDGHAKATAAQELPPPPPYSHSTPRKRTKRVLFEKVNYEKYKKVTGLNQGTPSRGSIGSGKSTSPRSRRITKAATSSSPRVIAHNHYPNLSKSSFNELEDDETRPCNQTGYFSDYDSDRNHHDYGSKWCQDLLNWSREAAEYQRQHQHESGFEELSGESGSANWFQDKFRGSSAVARYNKMSATDDSGVAVSQLDESDGDEWRRDNSVATTSGGGKQGKYKGAEDNKPDPDSWNALKQRVFEPPEVLNDHHRLGRRCSCNSMCTSLCTLETWLDDEIFDNTFNEELERRCGISTN